MNAVVSGSDGLSTSINLHTNKFLFVAVLEENENLSF